MGTELLSVSVRPGTLEKLDKVRGDVKRSTYVDKWLNKHLDGLLDGKKKRK